MFFRVVLLVFGIWACSTSVIMIKASSVPPVLLASYRLLVAAAALSPLFLRDLKRHRGRYSLAHVRRTVLPGVFLSAHFALWIFGARMTAAAHATLIVNTMPLIMPFLLFFMVREVITRGEVIGTVIALAGVGLLCGTDLGFSRQYVMGDGLCFVSMTMLAVYMALARRNRDFPSIWLYVTPLYLVAGLICLVAGMAMSKAAGTPLALESSLDLWCILGLGMIPTVIGHSIINYSMKHFRGQLVSIAALGEFIFAGVMAYFLLTEAPRWSFYPAAALVVVGAILAVRATPEPTLRAELSESLPNGPAQHD